MTRRRHTPEQIIRKLAEGQKLLAGGAQARIYRSPDILTSDGERFAELFHRTDQHREDIRDLRSTVKQHRRERIEATNALIGDVRRLDQRIDAAVREIETGNLSGAVVRGCNALAGHWACDVVM